MKHAVVYFKFSVDLHDARSFGMTTLFVCGSALVSGPHTHNRITRLGARCDAVTVRGYYIDVTQGRRVRRTIFDMPLTNRWSDEYFRMINALDKVFGVGWNQRCYDEIKLNIFTVPMQKFEEVLRAGSSYTSTQH